MKPDREPESVSELYHIAKRALRSLSDEHVAFAFDGKGFDRAKRISNFDLCLSREDGHFRIAGGGPTGYLLYDATGKGCDGLREPALSKRIVGEIAELLTRFDYAVDIRCDVLPSDFANARSHNGFRTISFIKSDTGQTVYVGSPKSDRFCRVYRYNPPHPRADLLRVEYVFRRGMARAAATQYCEQESDETFIAKLGSTWGFVHDAYQSGRITDERISAPSVTRHEEDTIAWLYKQVLPAMRRAVKSGGFDMTDWLELVYNE